MKGKSHCLESIRMFESFRALLSEQGIAGSTSKAAYCEQAVFGAFL
jgi:hypothetical protein